jgi:PTH1 family peptidyl-tRNA hydrolase
LAKLLIALGNPGAKYQKTRHNAGVWAVNQIASKLGISFSDNKKFTYTRKEDNILVISKSFMNTSGSHVLDAMKYFSKEISDLVILHDDIDLQVGDARLKTAGGHGGQNGIRDIKQKLATGDFLRVRIGVGRDDSKSVADYVLSSPRLDDKISIDLAIDKIASNIELLFSDKLDEFDKSIRL